MIKRAIYTLYLYSRWRKLNDHYLYSGAVVFFLLYLNLFTISKLLCLVMKLDFIKIFMKHNFTFLLVTIVCFFLSQFFAKGLIRKIQTTDFHVKRLALSSIAFYFLISLLLLLLVMLM